MENDSSEIGNVQVEITDKGITITMQDKLAWKIEQDWSEISKIKIDTTEENLHPSDSNGNNFPITIDSGQIKIGNAANDTDTSLSEYKNRERGKNEQETDEDRTNIPSHWKSIQKETGIQFIPSTGEVNFPDDRPLTEAFSDLVRFLFDNNYMSMSDLPWTTPNARKNYVLNTEPIHKNGDEMAATEAIEGVFFDKKIPRVQRERHAKGLVEEFVEK